MITTSVMTVADSASSVSVQAYITPQQSPDPGKQPDTGIRLPEKESSEKSNRAVDLNELSKAMEEIETVEVFSNRRLQFKLNQESGNIQILVVNMDTNEVIREIPPTRLIEVAQKIRETMGLMIDTFA